MINSSYAIRIRCSIYTALSLKSSFSSLRETKLEALTDDVLGESTHLVLYHWSLHRQVNLWWVGSHTCWHDASADHDGLNQTDSLVLYLAHAPSPDLALCPRRRLEYSWLPRRSWALTSGHRGLTLQPSNNNNDILYSYCAIFRPGVDFTKRYD